MSIKEDFEPIRKKLKALDIIKNKGVNVAILLGCFKRNESVIEYLDLSEDKWNDEEHILTQKEYDLLKEALNYDD